MGTFTDKVAVITGAASGIGFALSQELCRRGARVIMSDIQEDLLEKAAAGLNSQGFDVRTLPLDVTDDQAFKAMIDRAISEKGRLDYIFNNAGIAVGGEVQDCEVEDWRKVLEVNLFGVIHGTVHAYKAMLKQGFGHIVNIASIEGLTPFPCTVSYVTSKYGVVGLTNGLRVEASSLGIDVSVVCPGFIQTSIFETSKVVNIDRQNLLKNLPMNFSISAEECARRICNGVEKKKAFIVVTGFAKVLWAIGRISPSLLIWLVGRDYAKTRKDVRLQSA
ncbi:Short-chain dehydrogenase [Desulfatibacillum alkenivorans DSM 16219]|jgi:NAD(P)-dependent dehydrogenase (short-subunit alcohol dehydrogenase family)|uniref:Short-chain dehydrogenase n=1 Tax=Desulfatibacillum alkenivorans DSM 16219 TaxID=1121393 RepID=A0A1M6HSM2_9BACT|nr:SDR family oxidoreductase [Desulfatibacillum alkenivorans]SHJ25147.1 Short-chain dehydrogenase [Desulfatibacillum alkenivorans DSM 16219]